MRSDRGNPEYWSLRKNATPFSAFLMVNFIRRFQRPFLTALVIIVIIAFVYLFNVPSAKNGISHSDAVARIYGRTVNQVEVQKEGYRFTLCSEMQMTEMLFLLGGREAAMAA